MRIAVLNITNGGLSGGYQKYLDAVLPRLVCHPDVSAVLVGVPRGVDDTRWRAQIPRVSWCTLAHPRRLIATAGDLGIAEMLTQFRPDAVFIPTARPFMAPLVPVVTMLRNMEPLTFANAENPIPERIRTWARRRSAWEAVRRADRVLAISRFVREELVERWGIPVDRIDLAYHGVDPLGIPVRPRRMPAGWEDEFLFTAGSIRPARGLEDLLRALPLLPPTTRVAIAGGVDASMRAHAERLVRMTAAAGAADRVVWLGRCTDAEMAWCYRTSIAFIMTSRVEACPNTALEAMVSGCVTVSAKNAPLPEMFAEAAMYYRPRDAAGLSVQIREVLAWSTDRRAHAAARARTRAAEFTWDRSVHEVTAACARAMAERRSVVATV